MEKEIKVTGRTYGWDENNATVDFEEGRVYPYLRVASQFGWEDGCQDREQRVLRNVRCTKVNHGSPHHVAGCYFENVKEDRMRQRPCGPSGCYEFDDQYGQQCTCQTDHEYAEHECSCGNWVCSTCSAFDSRGDHVHDPNRPTLTCPNCGSNVLEQEVRNE